MRAEIVKRWTDGKFAIIDPLLGPHQHLYFLENFKQLRLLHDGSHLKFFEVNWLEVRKIVENLSKDKVDELLILVFLSNHDSIVKIINGDDISYHILKKCLEIVKP
jgi:hypothetical protein